MTTTAGVYTSVSCGRDWPGLRSITPWSFYSFLRAPGRYESVGACADRPVRQPFGCVGRAIEELERNAPAWGIPAPSCSNLSRRCAYYLENKTSPQCRLQAEEASAFSCRNSSPARRENFIWRLWMTAACCCAACSSPRAAPTPRRFPWRKWSPKHSNAGRRA